MNDLSDGPITAAHIPSVFYADLGLLASKGSEFVLEGLLHGWLLYMVRI